MKINLLYRDEKTIGVRLERYGVKEREGFDPYRAGNGFQTKKYGPFLTVSRL
ncbi:hypothetical protein IAQ67_20300 [Paenibacillus peoriae]|uniref:Uncharacterized protein n=1 Tax=Paenibacillus peoriae TaxID=59893 RepID=A0A7H0Y516_9BACL|nr:hypothetical protein [Paenibacillus peoriae]QNR66174.1 hypothetical protein IAQ67_20300 [Paenibacillus peoriae]